MRLTVSIEDYMVPELMRLTDARTKTEAVNRAISEWIRSKKLQKIKELRGKIAINNNLKEIRSLEIDEIEGLNG